MKQIVVVIKDKLIGCGSLMAFPNPESAVRSFKEIITGQNELAKHPDDHSLIAIGTYDNETGKLEGFQETRKLAEGHEFVAKEQ